MPISVPPISLPNSANLPSLNLPSFPKRDFSNSPFDDIRKKREKEIQEKRTQQQKESNKTVRQRPPRPERPDPASLSIDPKPSFPSSLYPLIQDQAVVLLDTLVPFAINFAFEKIGIDPNESLENLLCPSNPDELLTKSRFVDELNNFIDGVNNIGDSLDKFKEVINTVNPIINSIQQGITISDVSLLAIQAALKALPPGALAAIPGAVVGLPDDIDYIKSLILFSNDGTPRLPLIKAGISSINGAITLAQAPLSLIIDIVEKIKSYFNKCLSPQNNPFNGVKDFSPQVTGIVQNFQQSEQNINNDYYNGFLIEVEEKDFSPTVKQKRAVGKNKNGITLIQTPYSFTTDNQTLFNELKFIIDKDNLKAY